MILIIFFWSIIIFFNIHKYTVRIRKRAGFILSFSFTFEKPNRNLLFSRSVRHQSTTVRRPQSSAHFRLRRFESTSLQRESSLRKTTLCIRTIPPSVSRRRRLLPIVPPPQNAAVLLSLVSYIASPFS